LPCRSNKAVVAAQSSFEHHAGCTVMANGILLGDLCAIGVTGRKEQLLLA